MAGQWRRILGLAKDRVSLQGCCVLTQTPLQLLFVRTELTLHRPGGSRIAERKMIDTKKTYERLIAGFPQDQASLLTDVLKEQDAAKLELEFEKLNTKVNMLLVMLPICTAFLGWLITSQHPR